MSAPRDPDAARGVEEDQEGAGTGSDGDVDGGADAEADANADANADAEADTNAETTLDMEVDAAWEAGADPAATEAAGERAGPAGESERDGRGDRGGWWSRRSRRWKVVTTALAALVVVVAAGAFWVWRQIDPPGSPGDPVEIVIEEGTSAGAVAELLEERDVISSATVFRAYIRVTGAGGFRAGTYARGELRENMAMGDAVDVLVDGPEITYSRLTVPEGLTLEQVAERVDELPGRSGERFLELAAGGAVRSTFQPEGVATLEGLVFPDTYRIAEDETEEQILRRMVGLFEEVAGRVGLAERAPELGLTPYEAVVLASLVEEEARVEEDRPLISAVIHNRLEAGMLLQIDATVLYALGEHKERVLFSDLEVDSPYNTYQRPGLPPTPIAGVGEASLRAALDPADEDYRYYVKITEDGKHAFAETSAGHRENIAEAERRGVR